MSDPAALVYADLRGVPQLAGRLWTTTSGGRESATFEYDETWLANPERYALEPALTLGPGPVHATRGQWLFGALGDSAPDWWGRTLLMRAEPRRAAEHGESPRAHRELDFLLGVSDETRQGALRFARSAAGPFEAESATHGHVPPLVELPRLLAAADHVLANDESAEDLRLLLAPGSSLGGARPKASVRDPQGTLHIAKFRANSDVVDAVRWEAVALSLARRCGIRVCEWRIEAVPGSEVLLVRRFDRRARTRIPFLSALSMLGAADGATRSYVEIADALRQHGAAPQRDLAELWRRMVFNVMISNGDDHLRNHAFLYDGTAGWRLSPAYDLNPEPADVRPHVLSTPIGLDGDLTASVDLAMEVSPEFSLSQAEARTTVTRVRSAVREWRSVAAALGLSDAELDRMASAFHV